MSAVEPDFRPCGERLGYPPRQALQTRRPCDCLQAPFNGGRVQRKSRRLDCSNGCARVFELMGARKARRRRIDEPVLVL